MDISFNFSTSRVGGQNGNIPTVRLHLLESDFLLGRSPLPHNRIDRRSFAVQRNDPSTLLSEATNVRNSQSLRFRLIDSNGFPIWRSIVYAPNRARSSYNVGLIDLGIPPFELDSVAISRSFRAGLPLEIPLGEFGFERMDILRLISLDVLTRSRIEARIEGQMLRKINPPALSVSGGGLFSSQPNIEPFTATIVFRLKRTKSADAAVHFDVQMVDADFQFNSVLVQATISVASAVGILNERLEKILARSMRPIFNEIAIRQIRQQLNLRNPTEATICIIDISTSTVLIRGNRRHRLAFRFLIAEIS